MQGGTAASKTVSTIMWLIVLAQHDKEPTLTSIVSESFPHLKRGAIRDFLNIMEAHGFDPEAWNKTDYVYTFQNGSKIEFFSADQPGKVRGPRRDRLFINEANNIPFETFEQLEVRTKEFIYIDFNPVSEFWFEEEIKGKRDDYDHLILTYKDNEALDERIIQSIEQRKGRPGWWKVYGEGLLGSLENLIYPEEWNIIDEIPKHAKPERKWLDFGYTNDPTASGTIYYADNQWYLDEGLYRKGLSNKQIADYLIAEENPDTLIVADSAEPKSIDELKLYGLNVVGSKKGRDSVNQGIQLVRNQPINITKRSINILKEKRNYLWMTDKNGKILNEEDPACANHHMAGIRYAFGTLGRIEPPKNQWDRLFEQHLQRSEKEINLAR